jgi:hypothetical protein
LQVRRQTSRLDVTRFIAKMRSDKKFRRKFLQTAPLLSKAKGEIGYAFYRVLGPRKLQTKLTPYIVTALDSEYELPYHISYTSEQIAEKTGGAGLPGEYVAERKPFVTFCFGVGEHVARWKPDKAVTLDELCGWMLQQLDAWGVNYRPYTREQIEESKGKLRNPTIVVLSHYVISELQHITDGAESFREYGAGYVGYARFADEPERDDLRAVRIESSKHGIKFAFIDTYPIFGMGLEKLSADSPYPKRRDDELWHGKRWKWWRAHPSATFVEDEATFWRYAEDDVRGLLFAVNKWRKEVWENWQVDILWEKTFGAIALRILQGHYLKEPTEPWIKIRERGIGELGTSRQKWIFDARDPDWLFARSFAMDGYKGGRRETAKPGYTTQPIYHHDVTKEYTVSAIMQPLPNPNTKIKVFRDQKGKPPSEFAGYEGIVECDFKFPENTRYPCLPVEDPEVGMLLFPLEGRSICGLAEIPLAVRMGAEIRIYRGFTFKPGPDEVNHPIRRFLEDVLRRANELKGSPGERFFKNIANGLIGKLCQRNRVESHERMFGKAIWKDKFAIAGPGWSPILAALILSRARAIYGELLTLGDVVYGHTDSIFTTKPIDLEAPIIQELRKYGSGLKFEGVYQPFWSPRAAVFWGRQVGEDGKPKLDAEGNPIIDTARHAISSDRDEFAKIVGDRIGRKECADKLWFINERQPKPGGKEPPGHTVVKITAPEDISKYDLKRKPTQPTYNRWAEQTDTTPWANVAELIAYVKALRKQRRRERQRVEIEPSDLEEMRHLQTWGKSVNEIARNYPQYSRKTIQRRLKEQPGH